MSISIQSIFTACISVRICIKVEDLLCINIRGARGVVVIVVGNEHGDTSSNPGRDWLHFT